MSQSRDDDDFLGWAPDIGFWDEPLEPSPGPAAGPSAVVVPPTPQQTPARRSAPARPPTRPAPPTSTLPQRRSVPLASKLRVPALVAAAVMLVFTLFTALTMATTGPNSSPVMLGVFGVLTALLVRLAWALRRR